MKLYLKKLLFRLLILVIIIIILFFGLEFILSLSKEKREMKKWIQEDNLINKMNTDKLQVKDWGSNQLWLHEGETLPEKKDNIKRILIIGDSYIWGHGYDNANHIWWQQFKQKLKQNGYNDVEVIAAGVNGLGTQQEFEFIIKNKDLMKQINPDLIVFGYVSNDPELRGKNGEYYIKTINNSDLFNDSKNIFINAYKNFFPYTYDSLNSLITNKFKNNPKFIEYFGVEYWNYLSIINSEEWLSKYELNVIRPLKKYMDENFNIPYFFFITAKEEEPGVDNVIDLFKSLGINCYLAFDEDTKNEQTVKINPVNWHPSVSLCNIYANNLLKVMENNYKDILGNKGSYEAKININDWMPYKLNVKRTNENTYNFTYPNSNNKDDFLSLRINKDYVKLNLEEPIALRNISIAGVDVEEIEVFINTIDKNLGYDTQKLFSLGKQKDKFYWELDGNELVTSINVNAKIKDGKQAILGIELK